MCPFFFLGPTGLRLRASASTLPNLKTLIDVGSSSGKVLETGVESLTCTIAQDERYHM
jgi:hypothetical protein